MLPVAKGLIRVHENKDESTAIPKKLRLTELREKREALYKYSLSLLLLGININVIHKYVKHKHSVIQVLCISYVLCICYV